MVKSCQKPVKIDGVGRTILLVLIYFLFLYSFQVPGFSFGTVTPVLFLLVIYIVFAYVGGAITRRKSRTSKMIRSYLWWNVFLLVYVFGLLQLFGRGDGNSPVKDYIQMLIILPLFYVSGNIIFRDIKDLMKVLYIGVIIQTIVILAALFIPSLTTALFLLIPEGSFNTDYFGGIDMITQYGYHIGLGVFTSGGCLKMAIGQIGAFYYLVKSRGVRLCYHLFVFLLITIATSVVARTGLLISIIGLLVVFLVKKKQDVHRAFSYVFLVLLLVFITYLIITTFFSASFLGDIFQRFVDTADRGIHDTYFKGYTGEVGDNAIPPLCMETLIGLGITYGVSGAGITTITDGGFLRNYSAMGLIVALINYSIIISFFIRQYKSNKSYVNKGAILFLFLIMLIGEFKEYYIYSFSSMCFAFLIFSLIEKEEAPKRFIFFRSANLV